MGICSNTPTDKKDAAKTNQLVNILASAITDIRKANASDDEFDDEFDDEWSDDDLV